MASLKWGAGAASGEPHMTGQGEKGRVHSRETCSNNVQIATESDIQFTATII